MNSHRRKANNALDYDAEHGPLAPPGTPVSYQKGKQRTSQAARKNGQGAASSSSDTDSPETETPPSPVRGSGSPTSGNGTDNEGSKGKPRNAKNRRKKQKVLQQEDPEHRETHSWWNPQMILENSGSVARDHLASERTFLAYVRTSLGLASMGVALVQLFTIAEVTQRALGGELSPQAKATQRFAEPLGALTIGLALVVLLQGLYRFFNIQSKLILAKFPVARASTAFTGFTLSAIVIVIFSAILSAKS